MRLVWVGLLCLSTMAAQEHFVSKPPPGVGSAVLELVKHMVQIGLFTSPSALAGQMLGFTVVDEQKRPVPNAAVYVFIPEVGTLKIGYADSRGNILLAFSQELLERNPVVFGEKGGKAYGVRFQMTWGGALGEGPGAWRGVEELKLHAVGVDGVWAERGVPQEWVEWSAWVLRNGRDFLKELLGWEPLPFGILLSLQPTAPMVPGGKLELNGQEVVVFPYSIGVERRWRVLQNVLHEWAEQTLVARFQRLPRWVADGLATYAQWLPLRKAVASWQQPEGLQELLPEAYEYVVEGLERARAVVRERSDLLQYFDLLHWEPPARSNYLPWWSTTRGGITRVQACSRSYANSTGIYFPDAFLQSFPGSHRRTMRLCSVSYGS